MTDDDTFMKLALAQAHSAMLADEVPVGAVVVRNGQVISVGCNAPIGAHDPTAHAEIVALRAAAKVLGNYRLDDCDLFVTLEPCAMCAGAMLHARIKRVVFGAPDPKTGAAGSVVNLFSDTRLNHQTEVQGGVLADQCASFLQDFFKRKRDLIKMTSSPVREDALRTPDSRFDQLPDYPWAPNYVSDLPTLAGLRMHFLDEGPRGAPLTYLCLHANPAWSYQFRKMIPVLLSAGHRVVAPDLIGFGKSDKPKKDTFHAFAWHRQVLLELVARLDLKNIVLVVQDGGDQLGLTLPLADAHRYRGLLVMNSVLVTDPECAGYGAPFPDRGHRAALRAFASMMPESENFNGADISRQARDFWENEWIGQTLMADGLQEQDQAIAQAAIDYFVAP